MADAVRFDKRSAERIAAAVKAHEREPSDGTGEAARGRPGVRETVLARLTATSGQGFEWEEVYPKEDGTLAVVAEGRVGKADQAGLAFDIVPGRSAVGPGLAVLRRAPRQAADGTYAPAWVIVSAARPMPTARYQVETPIDDTLIPIWTKCRLG